MTPRHDASDIARLLGQRAQALTAELLPQGRREGQEWVSRCPWRGDRSTGSFKVRIAGPKSGLWSDFASGESGDALDLVAAVMHGGDKGSALRWARAWLGLSNDSYARAPAPVLPPPADDAAAVADAEERRRAALAVFLAGQPSILGTPVAAYLEGRGIDLVALGRQPRALRFHPTLWCKEAGRNLPGMVAAITSGAGEHLATHRTYLAETAAGHWGKAPVERAKMVLGSFAGGFIPLWRGASGKALAQAPAGETVAIAEGIETGLSVAVLCPELRVIAGVSVGNLQRISLPANVATVILCVDNDGDNSASAAAVQRAVDRFTEEGRTVRIARSPVGSDFNDALTLGATA